MPTSDSRPVEERESDGNSYRPSLLENGQPARPDMHNESTPKSSNSSVQESSVGTRPKREARAPERLTYRKLGGE